MPKQNSLRALLADWESLLTAIRETPYEIPGVERLQADLEQAIERTRALKTCKSLRLAASRLATRQLRGAVARSRETAFRTRCYVRGCLGPRHEDLARFGISPIRKRGPRRPVPPQLDVN